MYILTHREPTFPGTPAAAAYGRVSRELNRGGNLDGYEYVAERELLVLAPDDTREPRELARTRTNPTNGYWGMHVARPIEGGWELNLVIAGD